MKISRADRGGALSAETNSEQRTSRISGGNKETYCGLVYEDVILKTLIVIKFIKF